MPLKLFEEEVIESAHLIADSLRKAFYHLFLETDGVTFLVRKQWGCKGSKAVKETSSKYNDEERTHKRYKQILKQKTNPHRKSKRTYTVEEKKS